MPDALAAVLARSRAGEAAAIPSVCSAHPEVIAASLALARDLGLPLCLEATSNQVNQDGGYTGQRPADFAREARRAAQAEGLDPALLVLGGDHLGPQAWRGLPPEEALPKAHALVRAYAEAGLTKIHLDCAEGCAGEPPHLPDDRAAPRAADLARTAAEAASGGEALTFVVGTEVPPPGGARAGEGAPVPTSPAAARATLDAHRAAFGDLAPRIGALVVQPGVEFGALALHHLPDADPGLRAVGLPLEAHSTDYQRPQAFPRLAALGFAVLKVGPALTFAWREALYALDSLARVAGWGEGRLADAMDDLMVADPSWWRAHLDPASDLRVQRVASYADRIRYYWPRTEARAAVSATLAALDGRPLPDPLLRGFFREPMLARAEALPGPRPQALLRAAVQDALRPYFTDAP